MFKELGDKRNQHVSDHKYKKIKIKTRIKCSLHATLSEHKVLRIETKRINEKLS